MIMKQIHSWRVHWRYLRRRLSKHVRHTTARSSSYLGALLYVSLGLGALTYTFTCVAFPAYEKIVALYQEQQKQEAALRRVEQFAASHADYGAYAAIRLRELQQLRSKLPQWTDLNQAQGRLQQLAMRQGLLVKQLQLVDSKQEQLEPKKNQSNQDKQELASKQLQIELAGDYFALVRWLKQAERQHIQVERIEIKGHISGMVQANMCLRCFLLAKPALQEDVG